MLYLVLAVVCSVSIGMIFKTAGRKNLDRTALLTINYAAAVAVAGVLIGFGGRGGGTGLTLHLPLLMLGIGTGALLIFGFFMLSLATDVAGMSLSLGVMRVSVIIPFLASWFIWSEEPTNAQLAGMGCAAVAFFLIARTPPAAHHRARALEASEAAEASDGSAGLPGQAWGTGEPQPSGRSADASPAVMRSGSPVDDRILSRSRPSPETSSAEPSTTTDAPSSVRSDAAGDSASVGSEPSGNASTFSDPGFKAFVTLLILFLSGGAVDITMKTFQESFGADNSRFLFLLLSFGVAFVIGAIYVVQYGARTGSWPSRETWAWGVLLGVINYGSLEFLLRALDVLPGTVVFPVNNIAIVILGATLGVAVWHERLTRVNAIGLACAVLGLVLLSL